MKATKTGKIRYRTQSRWFGKELVVLQMEWLFTGVVHHDNCGGMIDSWNAPDHKEWRDATVEDLTEEILV